MVAGCRIEVAKLVPREGVGGDGAGRAQPEASRSILHLMKPARPPIRLPRRRRWWAVAVLWLLSAVVARANHLVGTDWRMTAIGGNQFRVRLTVYTDPVSGGNNSSGDPSVTIGVFERRLGPGVVDRLVSSHTLPRTGNRALPGPPPGCGPNSAPVLEIAYEDVLTLDPALLSGPDGYYLAWERCCRNQLLTNIPNGQNAPLAATLRFPALSLPLLGGARNSAPRFGPPPPAAALCRDEPVALSFAATDPDPADSLAYALVPALGGYTSAAYPFLSVPNAGPYPVLLYSAGFSGIQPLPGTFALNPRTGLLTGVPVQAGTYLVAVAVREYRRGTLIGENRRELELSVTGCPPNAAPTLTQLLPAPPDTVLVAAAADRCLTVRAADANPGQTLTVRAVGPVAATITPARFTIQFPPAPVDVRVCLTECATPGRRLLTLVVTDDGCRPSRPDTLRIPLLVAPAPNRPPTVARIPAAPDTLSVAAGAELVFTALATDPDGGPLSLALRPAAAPGLAPIGATGTGTAELPVRWAPPCDAARPQPYTLWLRATDDACQNAADSLRVLVRVTAGDPVVGAALPNVITPNADGRNDCFGLGPRPENPAAPAGLCTDDFQEVRIFNRWGRLVYQSADLAFCWAAPGLAAGTYHYLIRTTRRAVRGLLTVER